MSTHFVAALEAEIEALQQALSQDLRYVRLREIERLRELYRDPSDDATDGVRRSVATFSSGLRVLPKPPLRKASPERTRAIDAARLYVLNRAGPVPTSDIYEHVKGLGITIRGENPVNNLSAMLSNSGVFKSNGRAGWTISKSNDSDLNSDEEIEEHDEDVAAPRYDLDDDLPPRKSTEPSRKPTYDLDDDIPF